MAVIKGITKGKHNNILSGVSVFLKDDQFHTTHETISDENGYFELTVPDGVYPFLAAVRDYADQYLEYWAHNIPAYDEINFDIHIDTLEIYGINAFSVKGAAKALSVYFRPMSLDKFRAQEADISPDFDEAGISAMVNGLQAEVLVMNKVQEYIESGFLTAYLIQISIPDGVEKWERIDLMLRDFAHHMGCATIFKETGV